MLAFGIDQDSVVDLVVIERIRQTRSPVVRLIGTIIANRSLWEVAARLGFRSVPEARRRDGCGVDQDRPPRPNR
jgi:hypothetical protein